MVKKAVISFHDASPAFQKEIELVIKRVHEKKSFLITPLWHGSYSLTQQFISTVKDDDLVLHGLLHKSEYFDPFSILFYNRKLSREFLFLNYQQTKDKIVNGMQIMKEHFGFSSRGFIPPMWYHNQHLKRVLRELNFTFTETWTGIINLGNGGVYSSYPLSLDYGNNVILSKAYLNWWQNYFNNKRPEVVRVVIHPSDVNNALINHFVGVIGQLKDAGYTFVTYNELLNKNSI